MMPNPLSTPCTRLLTVLLLAATWWPAFARAAQDPGEEPPKVMVRERTVYVPYEELKKTFEKEGRGIFLPYAEFLKLWNQAQKKDGGDDDPDKKPPTGAVISGGHYKGVAKEKVARFEVTYQVQALGEKWSEVELPLKNVALETVKLSDEAAVFTAKGDGYRLILPKPGTYTLTLAFSVGVESKPGKRTLDFGIPPTAVSRLDLEVPDKDVRVEVLPKMAATTTETEGETTRVLAFVGNSDHVTVTWMPPVETIKKGEALMTAAQYIHADLGERILRLNTTIAYTIERNEVESLSIKLPADMRLLSVKGDNIRTWNADNGALTVRLHSPVKEKYALALRFERILDETPKTLAVPAPQTQATLREDGYLVLSHEEGLRVRATETKGLSQVDPQSLPANLRVPRLLAGYRYMAHPLALNLDIERIQPEIKAASTSVISLGLDDDALIGWVDYEVSKVGVFTFKLRAPKYWEVSSMGDANSVEDYQVAEDGEFNIITVNLKNKVLGAFRLPYKFTGKGRAAPSELTLQPVQVLDVSRDKGLFGVSAPKAFKLTTVNRDNAVPANVQQLYAVLGQLPPNSDLPLGYAYNSMPASVSVKLERRKTEIRVTGFHVYTVAESGLESAHTLNYLIEFAAVDKLRFSVPSALDDRIHVVTQNLKEKKKISEANGRSIWELSLQEKVLGAVAVRIDHQESLKDLKQEEPHDLELADVRAEEVQAQSGYVAVRKEGTLEIKETAVGLEPEEAINLPAAMGRQNVYLAFRYFQPEHALTLTLTKHVPVKLVHAVVNLMRTDFVVSEEGRLTARAEMFVENVQGEQYLAVRLPESAKIRSLAVAGASVAPLQRKDGARLVKLPTGGPFPVQFVYVVPGPDSNAKLGWWGGLDLTTPVTLDDVPINKTELNLFLPEHKAYMSFRGTLHHRAPGDVLSNTLARLRRALGGTPPAPVVHDHGHQFRAPPGPIGGFTTQGVLYRFETLAPEGSLSFTYVNRKLFWFFDLLVFAITLIVGWRMVRRQHRSRLVVAAAFVLAPMCLGWFMVGAAAEPFLAWMLAGWTLAAVFLFQRLREAYGHWREAKIAMAPDPFLEDAPEPPRAATPPAGQATDSPGESGGEDVEQAKVDATAEDKKTDDNSGDDSAESDKADDKPDDKEARP